MINLRKDQGRSFCGMSLQSFRADAADRALSPDLPRDGCHYQAAPIPAWVLVDEHPDSINDACAFTEMTTTTAWWVDLPASYHHGACGYSFADGHSEIMRWLGRLVKQPVRLVDYDGMGGNAPADVTDFRWHQIRSSAPK